MSRTNRFLGGLGFGFLQQVLMLVVGLWLTPFFLARLGEHDYGLWLIITQVTAYLALLDLGVVGILPRETAFVLGRGGLKSPELPRLIGQTARMVLLQWPVVAICAVAAWFLGRAAWPSAELPLGIILLAFVVMFPLRLVGAVLQGLQDLAFLGRAQIIGWGAGTVTAVILVLKHHGLLALALSWTVSQFVASGFSYHRIKRHFPGVLPSQLCSLKRSATLGYLKKAGWVSTSQVAQVLTTGTDLLLLGKLLGPAATVPYSCTGKLAGVLANKPQMIMQAAAPALSELKTAASRPGIRQATVALSQAVLGVSGGVACVVLAINRGFVEWWIGPNQYGGELLTLLIVIAMLARHWNLTFVYSLFSYGYERRLAITGVADGTVSTIASMVLVPHFGVLGAPAGMLIGTCLISMPANLIALARETETSVWELIGSSTNWVFRFTLAAASMVCFSLIWNPHGPLQLAALVLVAGIVYLGLLMPIFLQEPLGSYIRPKLRLLPPRFQRIFPVLAD